MKANIKNHTTYILFFGSLLIMFIGLYDVLKMYCLTIINDEFGYWANAAHMAGKDWSSLLSTSSFYSYGYSFLLVPLYRLGVSAEVMYQLAIVINVLLMVFSFLLTAWLGMRLFDKIDKRIISFVSLVVTLYLNNIFQMKVAWTETVLYFTFWAIAVLLYRVIEPMLYANGQMTVIKPKIVDLSLFAVAAVYIYTVHNRAIGVTIAAIFVIFLFYVMSLFNKKPQHRLLIAMAIMFILIVLASLFRQYIIDNWYSALRIGNEAEIGNINTDINDFSGQANKFKRLTTLRGITDLALSFAGKLYYQATASFLLIFLPLVSALGLVVSSIFKRKSTAKWTVTNWVLLFCSCAYVLEIGVASFYKSARIENLRALDVLYGRYPEFAIGPMLLFGFAMLLSNKEYLKEIIIGAVTYFITAILVAYQLNNVDAMFVNLNNLTSAYHYFNGQDSVSVIVLKMTLVGLAGFLLAEGCAAFAKMQDGNKQKNILVIFAITIISLYWCFLGISSTHKWVAGNDERGRSAMGDIHELVKELDPQTEIYYFGIPGDRFHNHVKILQSMNPDRTFRVISFEEAMERRAYEGSYVYMSGIDNARVRAFSEVADRVYSNRFLALYLP